MALAQSAEEHTSCSLPVRELVGPIPAPRGDHGQNEAPALTEQFFISIRIVLADIFGDMGEVELDGPTAARLEIDEQQPGLRTEHVAWMRLAVQELLGRAAVADRLSPAPERADEKLPIRVGELRSEVTALRQPLSLCHPIREVRRPDIEVAQAGVQPLKCMRIVGW